MPREFIPAPRSESQLLRDLCDHVNFPLPTAYRVEADRADVLDEIDAAKKRQDPDFAKLLESENRDLLNDDRESVLERQIAELRAAAETGDRAAGQKAARLQLELNELRDRKVIQADTDDTDDTDDGFDPVPVDTDTENTEKTETGDDA